MLNFKKSFVQVPEVVLKKKLSLRAVYIYAKMLMLNGKVYDRKSWVTNPISKQQEMSVDALSDITKRLEDAGLIRLVPVETKKSRYKTNTYEIVPQQGYYKPVSNDFINDNLSAEAKGLAILMSLLKEIPTKDSAIAKAIGVSTSTVKKYISELEVDWTYLREDKLLDEDFFPYYKQVREKRERRVQKLLKEYREWMGCFPEADAVPTAYYQRTMNWLRRKNIPDEIKAWIWLKATMGFWKVSKKERQRRDEEEQARKAKIIDIEL